MRALARTAPNSQKKAWHRRGKRPGSEGVKELCTEIRHERVSHRRRESQLMGLFSGFCRSVNRLATSTALISQRAVAAQVEAAHSSQDVAQGMVQITNVLDAMLTARSATPSELGVGDTEESFSLNSLAVLVMDPRRYSARHNTACELIQEVPARPLHTQVGCVVVKSDIEGHRGLPSHVELQ
ncbi:hypothetical protein NDU88_003718 [Pleurodeles waltl]|uniref:Uncharacterized protein n=1 Tax=Pleurodeles waltl TaxID=8319 RepID=A0AAV7VHK8_PLEWA|nr:hypothetical protein NDU88_003718 [Pleurodeles waltl]